jgi:sugar phosphate isomerase/epimerase
MLQEMAALGFTHIELSHGIRITLVPGIMRAADEGVVKISSTHNFCPLPTGVLWPAPNLYEPSAQDRAEQEQWLRHTLRSIDFAAQLNGRAIVCHLGSVRFSWFNPARGIHKYLLAHPDAGRSPDDKQYQALVRKSIAKLRKRMRPFWAQVKASLTDVVDYAGEKGIQLGFENRERFEELPLDADHVELLESYGGDAPVGYWHDTGHAELKERMGLLHHRVHLEALARKTIGFHLHDVNAEGHDHQPIGAGNIDFEMVSQFWRPEHLLTLEFSPRVSIDQVRDSKERLEALIARRNANL